MELLSPITISHQKINQLVKQAGRHLKEQQTSDERYDELTTQKRTPKTLYIEGDGFQMSTVGNKRLEIHRFQICEGVCSAGKNRKERICARDFISTDRQLVVKEVIEYIENTYNLKNTLVISNGDGGVGYTKDVFDEISCNPARHEYFLDTFHVNKKIKERLIFAKELQEPLMHAISKEYDRKRVEVLLNTAESLLIDELDTEKNHDYLRKLRGYIDRNWEYIKPFEQRGLGNVQKITGTCESNHRLYTYRMKGQGKYWTKEGAESMIRFISSLKNNDLDMWLNTEYHVSVSFPEYEKQWRVAIRVATA